MSEASHIVRERDLKIQTANRDKISVGERREAPEHVCKQELHLGMLLFITKQ